MEAACPGLACAANTQRCSSATFVLMDHVTTMAVFTWYTLVGI